MWAPGPAAESWHCAGTEPVRPAAAHTVRGQSPRRPPPAHAPMPVRRRHAGPLCRGRPRHCGSLPASQGSGCQCLCRAPAGRSARSAVSPHSPGRDGGSFTLPSRRLQQPGGFLLIFQRKAPLGALPWCLSHPPGAELRAPDPLESPSVWGHVLHIGPKGLTECVPARRGRLSHGNGRASGHSSACLPGGGGPFQEGFGF